MTKFQQSTDPNVLKRENLIARTPGLDLACYNLLNLVSQAKP